MTEPEVADTPRRSPSDRRQRRFTAAVLGGWVLLLVVARLWGDHLIDQKGLRALRLGSPPFVARDDLELGLLTAIPILVGLLILWRLPVLVRRLQWRHLLLAVVIVAAIWPVALNLTRGWGGITSPLLHASEYLLDVPKIDSPGEFLETFTEDVDDYVVHVRSHPPGYVLTLWSLDRLGLGGAGWAAALVIVGGASAAGAVMIAVRDVAGEKAARRAAPFVAVAPTALWIASSADALYAGVGAWAIAALVLATGRSDSRGDLYALGGGFALGVALMFSYGLSLLAVVLLPIAVSRRRLRPFLIAGTATVVVIGCFWIAGFDYLEGFETTRRQVDESVQSTRPFSYFAVSNIAALAFACGPAVVVGLTRLRDRATWLLVGGALAAVALADVSALSKGEVERIWLPFAVWILPAAGGLIDREPDRQLRLWLAAQMTAALALQTFVRTNW